MSREAEQALLGALLTQNSLMQTCELEPVDFSDENHAEIFNAIQSQISDDQPADMLAVWDRLTRDTGKNYIETLNKLISGTYAHANFDHYAKMVRASFKRRQALDVIKTLEYELTERRNFEAIDAAISGLMQIEKAKKKHSHSLDDCLTRALEKVDEAFNANGLVGISTGLKDLDESLGGFHNTDLIVIGARPAMGKTALLLNMALAANRSVGIVSGEQSGDQVGMRFISMAGDVDSQKLRTAKFEQDEWARLSASVVKLKGKPIWINDEPNISINSLKRQAREWKFRYKIEALYVDYIQKIRASDTKKAKYEQVTEVTEELKALAKELNIPVITLAQVIRDVDKRADKRPEMGDMSDASAIEKEADVIMTLYRPEVHEDDERLKGIAEIDVCKNRHGPIGMVQTAFIGKFMQFKDIAPRHYREDDL